MQPTSYYFNPKIKKRYHRKTNPQPNHEMFPNFLCQRKEKQVSAIKETSSKKQNRDTKTHFLKRSEEKIVDPTPLRVGPRFLERKGLRASEVKKVK